MMKPRFIIGLLFVMAGVLACEPEKQDASKGFVQVEGGAFTLNGDSYTFAGTNFWYGAYLGSPGPEGDRDRLVKELDILQSYGITNLRVLGASEESRFENALTPALIQQDGTYNEELLVGLDVLLAEMAKRDMKAVIFLNNYWEWSGGMSTYNEWFGDGSAVDPADGDWEAFMKYSARFYKNKEAQEAYRAYISQLVERKNTVTGIAYKNDPTIMSWQLANEPRPGRGVTSIPDIPVYVDWVDQTGAFIKSIAPHQLVSTGSEGKVGSLDSMEVYIDAHDSPNIDYLTFHMWAKNWGWFNPDDMSGTFPTTVTKATAYLETHVEVAKQLNKPIVMEEFGLFRDGMEFDRGTPVTYRDQYYQLIFDFVEKEDVFSGTNFWSWGGLGVKQHPDAKWRPGDPFTGDPPQEPQGLNSVFADDFSTLEIIKAHVQNLNKQ
ncbi:MAG: cellulase family glycosylhydrolase [Bacteroidota bacterium]